MEQSQPSNEEEQGLLRIFGQLCAAIDVAFLAVGISWIGNFGQIASLPSDQCFVITKGPRRGFAVLPVALKGRLSLDEWKPIMASNIFYQLAPRFRRVWYTAIVLFRIAWIGSLALFIILLLLAQPILALVDAAIMMFTITFLPRLLNYYTIRRLRLKADLKAADTVGRDLFVRTLVKIDGFHILDLEELKRSKRTIWQKRVYPWPTMIERLDNLRTATTSSSTS